MSTNTAVGSTTSWGKTTGKTASHSQTATRVHELLVEPETLQSLGQYVCITRSSEGNVLAADCDPEIAYSPRAGGW